MQQRRPGLAANAYMSVVKAVLCDICLAYIFYVLRPFSRDMKFNVAISFVFSLSVAGFALFPLCRKCKHQARSKCPPQTRRLRRLMVEPNRREYV